MKKLDVTKKHLNQAIEDVAEIKDISLKDTQKAISRSNALLFQRNLFMWTTIIGVPVAYVGGVVTFIKIR